MVKSKYTWKTLLAKCLALFFLAVFSSPGLSTTAVSEDTSTEQRPRVLFIYPVEKGFPFWDSQVDFASAVSDALGIDLDVAYSPSNLRNRFGADVFIKEVIEEQANKPDLVITSFWIGSEQKILKYLNEQNIAIIGINSDISAEQLVQLGKPRERYPNWLAQVSPDDMAAGYQLAQAVIEVSRNKRCPSENCTVNVFGITGLSYSAVSRQRADGLQMAIKDDNKSSLLNVVHGNWSRDVVEGMVKTITTRHSDVDAFWIASDVMTYGLLDGLAKAQITLPVNTVMGSIDWSPDSISLIKEQKMHLSLGGHFMEAGWAIILFYDYFHGLDFVEETSTIVKTSMSILDKQNISQIGGFLQQPSWSPKHLRSYSKHLNPERKTYNLNPLDVILEQVSAKK